MTDHRAVKFHRASAPYNAGEIAGFTAIHASRLVERGVAEYWPPIVAEVEQEEPVLHEPDILDGMDRAQLIAFGKQHLGMTEEPSSDMSDDTLRAAIRDNVDAKLLAIPPHTEAPAALMSVAPAQKGGKTKA